MAVHELRAFLMAVVIDETKKGES